MKKIFVSICVYLWTILLVFSISAQDFKTVQDGIEYAEMTRTIDGQPVKMNLLRMDLTKVRLDVVHALDNAIGTETVSSMAKRHGAIAAINAGFFRFDNSIFAGDAAGVLMIDGKLLSETLHNRTALLISNDYVPIETSSINLNKVEEQLFFAKTNETIISIDKLTSSNNLIINKKGFQISGINRNRQENEIIIYTPEFNRTTLTETNGIEVVVRKNKIVEINESKGSSIIPNDGFIISASGTQINPLLSELKLNRKVAVSFEVFTEKSSSNGKSVNKINVQAEDIVAGIPQLIKDGKIDITWEQEKTTRAFVETKHPRTAVAKLKDGKFLMITVDGRSVESVGIGLEDLSKILLELGATDAMNFDGGGSTTMFLDGKIVNKPSDKEGERKVSDAILVFPRKKI